MTVKNNVKIGKTGRKTTEKILEQTIHPIILFYGVTFSLFILYYTFFQNKLSILLSLGILIISTFVTYYNYVGRKIVITKNKFYVYRLGKKTISLSFSKDFLHIKYEKTRLGKILNYGTILLVTQENKYYKINFVNQPEELFYSAIEAYENVMSLVNPAYEKQLNKEVEKTEQDNFEKINT